MASADMERPCHLPFGTFPASLAAGINLFDVLAHTWDIAAATGVAWSARRSVAGGWKPPGGHRARPDPRQYAPEIPVAAAASPRQRFLAFTGRAEPR